MYNILDMKKIADRTSMGIHATTIASAIAGTLVHPAFYAGLALAPLSWRDIKNRFLQTEQTLKRNFGVLGDLRYVLESIGPELNQYFVEGNTEGKPFNRDQRSYIYKLAHGEGETSPFGTLDDIVGEERIAHSLYPKQDGEIERYRLTFGDARNCKNPYTIDRHVMVSGMSYGALGRKAVRAFARGAKKAGVPICTGEGGFPKYQLMEGANLIFQIGTAKFGVQNPDTTLNDVKLREISRLPEVKMIEIKLSQGAKPGRGGYLPKEKITQEIAELRGIPLGQDCYSPNRQVECDTPQNTIAFIRRVQDVSELPVGIKLCMGREDEMRNLVQEMKRQDTFPDYIAVDGAEGGTGAAPQTFLNYVGLGIDAALPMLDGILKEERVRDRTKIVAAGKLVDAGSQYKAMAAGADAVYTARGVMFAGGCIQALQCDKNTCPVGITTHEEDLQRGLDVEEKSTRVASYIAGLDKAAHYLLAASGYASFRELDERALYKEMRGSKTKLKIVQ